MPHDPPLIAALRSADCYAHAVDAIEVRETHISWVLLTGQFAYKIKKPVHLAFLDFSTLESRRRYCAEELRLNRRFAPDLYLAVVPITGTPAAPRMNGTGEPIEFAVQLRQFDPNEELAALVANDRVPADALHEFGSRLAQIHESSAAHSSDSKAWAAVQSNLRELKEVPVELEQWLAAEHARLQSVLDRRGASRRIRECHGDLHAGNVVRWHDELMAFDCIEFNPDLRHIDVADDVAFLMMDLIAHGRRDLAYACADGWLERAGDYEAALVWRWFRVHRALVRAKVARLQEHAHTAARYLHNALAELEPTAPRLIVMCGLSGSGKTWLSTQLLQALAAVRVRSDVERKRLAGLQAHESSPSSPGGGIYTLEFNDRVYAHLLSCARTVLLGKEHAIVDAACLRRHERACFIALAREMGVALTIVHCHAPQAELRSRLLARRGDASEATADVLERQLTYWEPFDETERAFVLEVDTRDADAVTTAISTLRAPP